jgi:hypothetical protein
MLLLVLIGVHFCPSGGFSAAAGKGQLDAHKASGDAGGKRGRGGSPRDLSDWVGESLFVPAILLLQAVDG